METLALLIDGFVIAFEPLNLALVIAGVVAGLFIGAMPGLGSVNGVAILLPMTFLVPPASAIIFSKAISKKKKAATGVATASAPVVVQRCPPRYRI